MTALAQPDRRRRREASIGFVPAILAAWVAVPFVRIDRWVTGFDTIAYSGPNVVVSLREIRHGRIPQWNPDIFGGITHIGNAQAAVFEPLLWIFSWLSPHRALLTIIVAHLAILTSGTWWLLAKRLQLAPTAAALGAIGVIGSGLVMTRSMQFEQIAVVSWVPWVLVGVDLTLDPSAQRGRYTVLPVAAALLAISGHPQQGYIAVPLIGLWAVGRLLDHGAGWRGIVRLATAGGLALGLAAAQLLPTAAALGSSAIVGSRDISDASIPLYSAQLRKLPGTVLGDLGATSGGGHVATAGGYEQLAFVGIVVAVLAAIGATSIVITSKRCRWTGLVLLAAMAFGTISALGPRTAVYRGMHRLVPGFDLARVPGRWMLLVVMGSAILAAVGLDQVRSGLLRREHLIGAGVVLALVAWGTLFDRYDRPSSAGVTWWAVGTLVVAGAAALAHLRPRLAAPAAVALVLVAALELGWMSDSSFARSSTADAPITDLGDRITERLANAPGRSLALTDDRFSDGPYLVAGLRPNTNAVMGAPSLDGYDGGTQVTTRWVSATAALTGEPNDPELTVRSQLRFPISPTTSARLGVRWLLVDERSHTTSLAAPEWTPLLRSGTKVLLENPAWVGSAVLYHRSVAAPEAAPAEALRTAPAAAVVVEPDGPVLTCDGACDPRTAEVVRNHPTSIDVALPDDAPEGLVVVDEQLADGWSARVDGRSVDLVEANGLYVGVPVPAGAERVELRFEAPGLRAGLVVSIATVLALIGISVLEQRRHRRGGRTRGDAHRSRGAADANTGAGTLSER